MEKIKEYERVSIELVYLKAADVICTSGVGQKTEGDEDSFGWA